MRAGEWDSAPPMLHARSAHNVVAHRSGIIALAGSGAGGAPVTAVERFDGTAWRALTSLPGNGLNAPASAVVGDRIYVIGGFNGVSNVPTDEVHIYDLTSGAWTRAAPLPAPRGGHAAVVLDGRIHVFGGGNSRSTIADHSMYDPATNTWTELAPLPFARGSPAGVVFNGRIYSIGGRSGASDFGDVDVYDQHTNTWTRDGMIEPIGTAGAVLYNGRIYLFGGESQARGESVRTVLRYDGTSSTWRQDTPMPTGRNYARAVVFGDYVYLVGGNPAGPASHSAAGSTIVERFRVRR
jgi:N-acetylneuraminic acid mutarotase